MGCAAQQSSVWTGTKIGCDRGACGRVRFWWTELPTPSCMTLALDIASVGGSPAGGRGGGRRDQTAGHHHHRGTGQKAGPAPAGNRRLSTTHCTVMWLLHAGHGDELRRLDRAAAHRRITPSLDEQKVREAIAGNLCRLRAATARHRPPPSLSPKPQFQTLAALRLPAKPTRRSGRNK